MTEEYIASEKVYETENLGKLSILDMLDYFEKKGAMRVSDLHIKVGAPPTYRIDGDLVKLKGVTVTPETAKQLIYPLLSDENLQKFTSQYSVDCSYRFASLQFRINVFQENDGICAAIRALSLDIPKVEKIGFPNDVWKDIINRKQGLVLLTGITGAGKSTTIASLIDRISEKRACRIITVEDPIEYLYQQKYSIISQREVGRDVKSFVDGLRAMLREDPDIIFVGEMPRRRDHIYDAYGRRNRPSGLLHTAHKRCYRHHNTHTRLFPTGQAERSPESALPRTCLRHLPKARAKKRRQRQNCSDGSA